MMRRSKRERKPVLPVNEDEEEERPPAKKAKKAPPAVDHAELEANKIVPAGSTRKRESKKGTTTWINIRTPEPLKKGQAFFPPTIHWSQERSLLVTPEKVRSQSCISIPSLDPSPVLSEMEVRLWRHKTAAHMASVHRRFPLCKFRMLGIITRTIQVNAKLPDRSEMSYGFMPPNQSKTNTISIATARKLAVNECEQGMIEEEEIPGRAEELVKQWRDVLHDQYTHHFAPWGSNGTVVATNQEEGYIPPNVLATWLPRNHELQPLLKAAEDLSNPFQLWNIPLLMMYPIVTNVSKKTYELKIGVYIHRMLPEVTTTSLKIVLDNLDEESFLVTRPCSQIPTPKDPVFQSSKYPIVDTDDVEDEVRLNGNDDPNDGDETKVLVNGEVQNTERISAYSTAGLLKLLEHTGADTTDFHKTYARVLQQKLKLPLMLHQEHAIAWMLQMEQVELNQLIWEEREFWDGGKYYCCPGLGQIRLDKPSSLRGGLLCDEMGLGKTIEVLGLIMATLPLLVEEAIQNETNHATLIVVPPALVAQWISEISKCVDEDIAVDFYDYRECQIERRLGREEADADIVVTTYKALETAKSVKELQEQHWGRIVLDEMQEMRSTTNQIAHSCEKLSCSRRWMLSGTPLYDGIKDLRGELNFLKLEPFAAGNEDGFFDFMIGQPWELKHSRAIDTLMVLSSCILRRSKSMSIVSTGLGLLESLPPITVQFVPIEQKPSERALYYFLESIVAKETSDDEAGRQYQLCLRLLRELCVSPMLLNGGMGVKSQLRDLNRLVVAQGRRQGGQATNRLRNATAPSENMTLSPKDAIIHLAQVQETTRTAANEVSNLALGFGQGVSKRSRAVEGLDSKLQHVRDELDTIRRDLSAQRCIRAKARWHWALETITSGRAADTNGRYAAIWRWRYALSISNLCITGWRPTEQFRRNLAAIRGFFWAQTNAYRLCNIPTEVKAKTLIEALGRVLVDYGGFDSLELACEAFVLTEIPTTASTWNAGVYFPSDIHYNLIEHALSNPIGIFVTNDNEAVPSLETLVLKAKQLFDASVVLYNVTPSEDNRKRKKAAKLDYELAKTGLRIVRDDKKDHIHIDSPFEKRETTSLASRTVVQTLQQKIEDVGAKITTLVAREAAEQKRFDKLTGLFNGNGQVASTFEALQALAAGDSEKTNCCICLESLGASEHSDFFGSARVSMTKCGHLYCRGCLQSYMEKCADNRRLNCPSCRKPIAAKSEVIFVDAELSDEEEEQRQRRVSSKIVAELSKILSDSHGRLSPDMWDHLYRSIDLPDVDLRALDSRVSSLPGHFLAHLRACALDLGTRSGDPLIGTPRDTCTVQPTAQSSCLSSKVLALLNDLPKDERSVVFATNKSTVQHLTHVFTGVGIGFRALYTGQHVNETETSIEEWKSEEDILVLIVQAGTAAAGITLTAASRMFLLEPFLRLSEEQQAYGRCHRIGQEKPVHVTTYFSPISIESRLLEWRKKAAESGPKSKTDANFIYVDESDESDSEDDELHQTRFLLNVQPQDTDDTASLSS